jgi:predicted N-acyltransferase
LLVKVATELDEVPGEAWDALEHGPSPFLRYGFLRALERSGSIGTGSGWHPFYIMAHVEEDGAAGVLVGAIPAFIKTHSYGEYIFDWSWAHAFERAGREYYPKLVVAAPVTPATGRRILIAPGWDADAITSALVSVVEKIADETHCSSIHFLFTTAAEQQRLAGMGFASRASFQFHWHNHGYESFDDFLSRLTSRKRKQIRKERRRALEAIDELDFVPGGELDEQTLDALDGFYRNTCYEHGAMDYLQEGFFHYLAEELPEHMQVVRARKNGEVVAGALYLETEQGLYGRYWGCTQHIDMLHFEVAYYAGIERAIERGIPLFEAGAQGEHKLLRGFMPSRTYSAHWIAEPQLFRAIEAFVGSEAREVRRRMKRLSEYGPYKQEG